MKIWIHLAILFSPLSTVLALEIQLNRPEGPAHFAAERLRTLDLEGSIEFSLVTSDPELRPEGFRIQHLDTSTKITAIDDAGLMYGGLELAELLATEQLTKNTTLVQNPHMSMRGSKFNIPLDARTPSYTDASDTAQQNIPAMWDFEFWKDYIDQMAEARFNFISLWSLNPFPSILRVPGYEDISLDDVWRSRTIRSQEHYHLWGTGLVTPAILENAEVVLEISIDEKIEFWRNVMAYGKSRNIDFYFVTWNIFTDGTFGKHGISDNVDNPSTRDYYRKSVYALFETYPDLKGIGLTTGENMHKVPFEKKEEWAFDTYGRGALEFAQAHPDRKIRFIHRQHMASPSAVLDQFTPLLEQDNIDFVFSFKYAKAHVYSATTQPYHQDFVQNLEPTGVKTIWTQRNDDTYYFRWGSPDFVRTFIKNIPQSVSQGHYLGSDQWIWARDFLHRDRSASPLLEITKHDFQWTLWGRLSYDPNLSNERFESWLSHRYKITAESSRALLEAWQNASMIYPAVTGFHWGPVDFKWYIEACRSRPRQANNKTGFHDVNKFIDLPPHKFADKQSIPDFVEGKPSQSKTPFETAQQIEDYAKAAEKALTSLEEEPSPQLRPILADIRIVAQMGYYYADKVRGSTELALYRANGKSHHQTAAIEHLCNAARSWMAYTNAAIEVYRNPLWTNRVGIVDFKQTYKYVLDDIRIAGGDPNLHDLPPTIEKEAEPIPRPWERLPLPSK